MKLPNDLIKATDYEKQKHRTIKEFECVNGKFVQHYANGGEHELTMQEIIDCLNAIATIDCDLQTAYAYIEGKKDKIADLEAKLALYEQSNKVLNNQLNKATEHISELNEQLAEKEKELILAISKLNIKEHQPAYCKLADRDCECMGKVEELKQQLAESEDKIKKAYREGLLQKQFDKDAEIMLLKQQLADKDKELEEINREFVQSTHDWKEIVNEKIKAKTEFAIQQLEKLRHYIWTNQQDDGWLDESVDIYNLNETIDQIIKELEGECGS